MTTAAAEITPEVPTFLALVPSALNTCDRCGDGVEAVVLVTLPNKGELMFCGGCGRKQFGYEHTIQNKGGLRRNTSYRCQTKPQMVCSVRHRDGQRRHVRGEQQQGKQDVRPG